MKKLRLALLLLSLALAGLSEAATAMMRNLNE